MELNYTVEMMTSTDYKYKASGVPFQSGYLCSGILPKQIMFEKIARK